MTDREALLRAVAATPDDDTPRLIYADCLQETGRPADVARAQFIRLQIDMARSLVGKSWFALSDRLTETCRLASQHAAEWVRELPGWVAEKLRAERPAAGDFTRGFVESFRLNWTTFARKADELLAVAPVRHVEFRVDHLRFASAVANSPFLLSVRALTLSSPEDIGNPTAQSLARSTSVRALEELDLSRCGVTDHGAKCLAGASHLKQLRTLRLCRSAVFTEGVVALASSPALPNLKEIDIRGCQNVYIWGTRVRDRFPDKRILIYG